MSGSEPPKPPEPPEPERLQEQKQQAQLLQEEQAKITSAAVISQEAPPPPREIPDKEKETQKQALRKEGTIHYLFIQLYSKFSSSFQNSLFKDLNHKYNLCSNSIFIQFLFCS